MGLYSMMSVFLLSLNFNIWQFATKHICYSNIYTTYIAIYVTSQQRMVSKLKNKKNKKKTKNKRQQKTKKTKTKKKIPTVWLEGQRKLSQNLARKICTRIYSLRCDCAIKKKGFRHFSNYWRHGTHCLLFQVFFSSFCKMAYRRISWNEVVHTSVHEIYTLHWVESRFSARKEINNKRFAFLKPPCKNGSFIYKSLTLRKNICTMY